MRPFRIRLHLLTLLAAVAMVALALLPLRSWYLRPPPPPPPHIHGAGGYLIHNEGDGPIAVEVVPRPAGSRFMVLERGRTTPLPARPDLVRVWFRPGLARDPGAASWLDITPSPTPLLTASEIMSTEERPGCLVVTVSRVGGQHFRPGVDPEPPPIPPPSP